MSHSGHLGGIETAHIKARQCITVLEHAKHIGHIRRVEVAQVKAIQTAAAREHGVHRSHLRRVEVAQVQARQTRALIEHVLHISHVRRVEKIKALEEEDVTLEQSFKFFEEGMELLKYCNESIDKVEKKVQKIMQDGQTEDFE